MSTCNSNPRFASSRSFPQSTEVLKDMVEEAGFEEVEVTIKGRACAIIRAKKGMGEGSGETETPRMETPRMETPPQSTTNIDASDTTPSSLSPPNWRGLSKHV